MSEDNGCRNIRENIRGGATVLTNKNILFEEKKTLFLNLYL